MPNESGYSDIVFGNTTLGPHAPEINISVEDFEIAEDSYNDTVINLYRWFKDVNNDALRFECKGQENISVTIYQGNGTVVLVPAKDWNGKETITFYANDSVDEVFDAVTITVTAVNDAPGPVEIIIPKTGLDVENGTGINFSGVCDDPDIIFGDRLTFSWSSNITGKFGEGENLTNIFLPAGKHLITLNVTDIAGESATATVEITIKAEDKDNGDNGQPSDGGQIIIIIGAVIIVIVVVLILLLFMFFRKKTKDASIDKKEETTNQLQPTQQQSEPSEQKFCGICGQGLRSIAQNDRYYCDYCKKYE